MWIDYFVRAILSVTSARVRIARALNGEQRTVAAGRRTKKRKTTHTTHIPYMHCTLISKENECSHWNHVCDCIGKYTSICVTLTSKKQFAYQNNISFSSITTAFSIFVSVWFWFFSCCCRCIVSSSGRTFCPLDHIRDLVDESCANAFWWWSIVTMILRFCILHIDARTQEYKNAACGLHAHLLHCVTATVN